MTLYGEDDIEVTTVWCENEPEFFSRKVVTGIAILVEQYNPEENGFADISFLVKGDSLELLAKQRCSDEYVERITKIITVLLDEIKAKYQ